MNKEKLTSLFLRIGLAAVFLYAAVDSFISPLEWAGFFPAWMRAIVPEGLLLSAFSAFEILLSLWLLWGRWVVYSALLSAAMAFGIIIFNLGALDIVFRDIVMIFAGLALAVLSYEKKF